MALPVVVVVVVVVAVVVVAASILLLAPQCLFCKVCTFPQKMVIARTTATTTATTTAATIATATATTTIATTTVVAERAVGHYGNNSNSFLIVVNCSTKR